MIETERLLIRPFNIDDGDDLFEYLSLPETYKYEPGEPVDLNTAEKLARDRSQGNIFFAVVLKKNRKMIGHLYFQHIHPKQYLTWELGFIFNPGYHNKGYATESSKALIEYAFRNFKTRRVVANCNVENPASWKVLEKIGMRREGYFLKKGFFKKDVNDNPIWFDSYQYAILKDSTKSSKGKLEI